MSRIWAGPTAGPPPALPQLQAALREPPFTATLRGLRTLIVRTLRTIRQETTADAFVPPSPQPAPGAPAAPATV